MEPQYPISNAKWNPINAPINSAKVQKCAEDEAVKRINEMSKNEKALTLAEAKQCVAVMIIKLRACARIFVSALSRINPVLSFIHTIE